MRLKGSNAYARLWWVKGEPWELEFKKRIEKDTIGLCDPAEKTFYIKRGLDKVELLKTAVHEIIHIFEEEYSFSLEHKSVYKLEEAIVDFIFNNFDSLVKIFAEK